MFVDGILNPSLAPRHHSEDETTKNLFDMLLITHLSHDHVSIPTPNLSLPSRPWGWSPFPYWELLVLQFSSRSCGYPNLNPGRLLLSSVYIRWCLREVFPVSPQEDPVRSRSSNCRLLLTCDLWGCFYWCADVDGMHAPQSYVRMCHAPQSQSATRASVTVIEWMS